MKDDCEQTRAVLASLAKEQDRKPLDLTPWLALQEWIGSENCDVWIPYAAALADAIAPLAVRLRRDFKTILTLIKAHAILHQSNRDRTAEGKIHASPDDYAAVRELVADLVGQGVEASVSPAIRQTVSKTGELITGTKKEVTTAELATALGIDKSAASRRIRVAVEKGYLRNLEEKKGRPARIVLGDPMPKEIEILPQADDPRLRQCGTCAEGEGGEGGAAYPAR